MRKELLRMASDRMKEERKNRITPFDAKEVEETGNNTPPQFNHTQINDLYQYGLYIPHEKLREIIALPRQTLIEDLENMLSDASSRYGYFRQKGNEEETHSFVLHAFVLLAEIHAEMSLPKLLSFLQYDDDFLEYWVGDHITETLWQSVYKLGFANTTTLMQFLLRPAVSTYSKSYVSVALCQMVLHHPGKREEVLKVFSETLAAFDNASVDDNLIDSEFLGLAVGDAIDCNLHELRPVIKALYDKGYVSLGVNGDYNEVERLFVKEKRINYTRDIYSILIYMTM